MSTRSAAMKPMNKKPVISIIKLLPVVIAAVALLLTATAHAAAPGITGTTFNLTAQAAYISQPDGSMVYSWGYACSSGGTAAPANIAPTTGTVCSNVMQVPGPTLIVTQGQTVMVNLTNNLPTAAGNTSILFPGLNLATGSSGVAGLLTREAAPGSTVSYSFVASSPGTRAYYSGTQGDLQVEMGLYGAIIVLPSATPTNCTSGLAAQNRTAQAHWSESNYTLARAAYNHPQACYDREYLFQFSEMDPRIHRQAQEQVAARSTCVAGAPGCSLEVATEPYLPAYYMINGRSMPDDMDPNYSMQYPHQPYNGNPHMHPGELTLLRIIGQGRWQHPFHEHGNHVRVLARDGNLLLAPGTVGATTPLAGPLMFTTTTTPGQTIDGIFQWTGKGLNWDVFGHGSKDGAPVTGDVCVPDANGYYTSAPTAQNYYEWCGDHNKALESKPFGSVGSGGPVTLPDPNIVANGPWYSGSPYLGGEATTRAVGSTPIPPSGTVANSPTDEAGLLTCGTRITSARSPPTTSSRAA